MPRGKKGVDLLPIFDVETAQVDSLAASAQATLLAQVIENVNTNEDYGSGSIKGLRLDAQVKPEAAIEFPPRLTVMVLPSGMTVPGVGTAASRKQNERFIWGEFVLSSPSDPGTGTVWAGQVHLKTARRFHSGDVLTFTIQNEDPAVAFGAAAVAYLFGRAYVSED